VEAPQRLDAWTFFEDEASFSLVPRLRLIAITRTIPPFDCLWGSRARSVVRQHQSVGPDDDFYLDLVMYARAVLDVGCGTGRLLARAAANGHPGRLVGLDPAAAMLVQARRRVPGVEWVLGDLRTRCWKATEKCATEAPPLVQAEGNKPGHLTACHYPETAETIPAPRLSKDPETAA
jgi:SAM-dependent methyltransferase